MKKIFYPLLSTLLVIVISINTSIGQEVQQRAKAELNVAKTEKLQANVIKSYRLQKVHEKKKLKGIVIREKAMIKRQPAELRQEKK